MWGLYLRARLPNLKFLPSAVLELLAFKAQKFTGSRDRDHAHFFEIFVRGHVGTIPGNTPAKFEVVPSAGLEQTDRQIWTCLSETTAWAWPRGDHAHMPDIGHRTSDNGQRRTDNGHREKWQERKQSLLPMQCIGQTINTLG